MTTRLPATAEKYQPSIATKHIEPQPEEHHLDNYEQQHVFVAGSDWTNDVRSWDFWGYPKNIIM